MGKLLTLKIATPPNRAAIIDEFGAVSALRDAFGPTEKRYGQLRDEIKTWYKDSPGDKDFIEKGLRFQLDVSMAAEARTIDIKGAYKKLGLAKFLKACTLTLKALGEFLGAADVDALTSTGRTGSRNYTPTPMGRPVEAIKDTTKAAA